MDKLKDFRLEAPSNRELRDGHGVLRNCGEALLGRKNKSYCTRVLVKFVARHAKVRFGSCYLRGCLTRGTCMISYLVVLLNHEL